MLYQVRRIDRAKFEPLVIRVYTADKLGPVEMHQRDS